MTFSIMTFSIMTFSIMTFSIMTFSIMTFSIMDLIVTLSVNNTQHNGYSITQFAKCSCGECCFFVLLCWVPLCSVLPCWMSLCWVLLCSVSWRLNMLSKCEAQHERQAAWTSSDVMMSDAMMSDAMMSDAMMSDNMLNDAMLSEAFFVTLCVLILSAAFLLLFWVIFKTLYFLGNLRICPIS
jgi:hypothetical protein